MTPSGYTTIGTVLKIDGTPWAFARDITYPDAKTSVLDTTTLGDTWKKKIPSKQFEAGELTVKGITAPTTVTTMLAMLVAGAAHTLEIDFTTGDACTVASAYMTSFVPGSASSGSPAAEEFTAVFSIDGALVFPAAAVGNWYDNVDTITVVGGDFGITAGTSPKTLVPLAIVSGSGFSFIPPTAALDWTSATGATGTIGLHTGIFTRVGNGTSVVTVKITAKPTVLSEVLATAT